ncbi:hypothetical protein BKA62DRAFT_818082 [Auriculariales sp. MPI-PUGE-AT-0066]|nr:hypothetical protein BKA62DRAFT_818082 [Auriculariales sp. MPI-PUGE-AT-0066]
MTIAYRLLHAILRARRRLYYSNHISVTRKVESRRPAADAILVHLLRIRKRRASSERLMPQLTAALYSIHRIVAEIAFICLNIAAFATTWGPAAWVIVGEIFPLPIRSRGVGMSTASVQLVLELHHRCHHAVLGPKVFLSATKGLSLEQIDQMLSETSPRTSSTWKPHQTWASAEGHVHGSNPAKQVVHDNVVEE